MDALISKVFLVEFVLDDGLAAVLISMLALERQAIQNIPLNSRELVHLAASTLPETRVLFAALQFQLPIGRYALGQALGAVDGFALGALQWVDGNAVAEDAGEVLQQVIC